MGIIKDSILNFINQYGDTFEIYREDKKLTEATGLKNKDQSNNKFIGFSPKTEIDTGDVIVNKNSGDKYYVINQNIEEINDEAVQKKAYYLTELEYQRKKEEGSLPDLSKKDSSQELNELIEAVKAITNYDISINRGALSKYKPVLEKYPEYKSYIANDILEWLIEDHD